MHTKVGETLAGEDICAPLCHDCEMADINDTIDAMQSASAGRRLGRVSPLPDIPPEHMTVELMVAQTAEQQQEALERIRRKPPKA